MAEAELSRSPAVGHSPLFGFSSLPLDGASFTSAFPTQCPCSHANCLQNTLMDVPRTGLCGCPIVSLGT